MVENTSSENRSALSALLSELNQEESNIGKEIIEQIKDFIHYKLTTEQQSLIDKLIPNHELKTRYSFHGLFLSKRDAEFAMQYNEVVELNENIEPNTISSPQAVYISRLLDFDNLPEPQNSKLINNEFHLVSETL
ncbi:9322_t:CDS:2, partial [Funneliformis caledonium]